MHALDIAAESCDADWIHGFSNTGIQGPREELKARADEAIEAFQELEAAELNARKMRDGAADDDGFITVTYKNSAKRRIGGDDVGEDGSFAPTKKKRRKKELQNFYGFQKREAKRDHLEVLRAKFEKDKARIARLKAARKFKPF